MNKPLPKKLSLFVSSFMMLLALLAISPRAGAALSNTLTWAGTTNTSVTASNMWSPSPAYAGANVWSLNNSTYQYVYSNSYSQVNSSQTFSYGGSNAASYGVTFTGYTNQVVVTNVGTFRLDAGGITATNASGTGKVTIWNTNTSQLSGTTTFWGNMPVYLNNLYNHASTGRTVTNNLNNLAINNFGVNAASSSTVGGVNGVTFTWTGSGTATILGTITQVAQTNGSGTATNNGALIVNSGTINIATTNAANASSTATNIDNSTVYGWNSGLVISNSGSVYVAGQNSLGMQAYGIKMGTTNGGTTTFGLFSSNNWATNASSDVTITNNFVLGNATANGTATNRFLAGAGNRLTLSGTITNTVAGNTLAVGAGTLSLSGNNSGLSENINILADATLAISNNYALGTGTVTFASNNTTLLALTNLNVANNIALATNGTINSGAFSMTNSGGISGAGALTKAGVGTTTFTGANTYSGTTTISSGALQVGNGGSTGSLGSGGVTDNASLILNRSDAVSLSNVISGTGSFTQAGAGTTTLTGANTYSGTTTVRAGTLLANSSNALGTSLVTVTNTGTLGGNGTIGGATTIATGGNLTPGSDGVGSLTFTNGLTIQTGAATTFRINSTNNFTSINLIGSMLSYGGDLVFNIASYTPAAGDAFALFNMTGGATQTGDFTSVTAGSLNFTDAGGIWSATDTNNLTYQFSDATGQLSVSQVVPEPSTYALFGFGAIGILLVLRRKKTA